jgi:hypothetical protein
VKIRHRVPVPAEDPPSHVETDEKYLAELEAARKKAEKAWRNAQQALERAEQNAAEKPNITTQQARDTAHERFEARERELAEIQRLMQGPGAEPKRAVHRAGKQERLETGNRQRRRR